MPLALFTACSSDDDSSLTLDKTSITLRYEGTQKLTASEDANWSTENEFFAEVDNNGLVTGGHVGQTYITATGASGSAKCLVEVVPEYNTYKAPVCEFGATMEDINSKESRTLYDLTTDQLVYRGENSAVQLVLYKFESGKLKAVGVFIDMSYATEVAKYLLERYQPAANSDGLYIFINNTPSKADMFVTFGLQSGSAMVMYTSRDNASDAKDAMAKARKLAMEFD